MCFMEKQPRKKRVNELMTSYCIGTFSFHIDLKNGSLIDTCLSVKSKYKKYIKVLSSYNNI